jgi:type II secretory pathway pseudopilin PulG
MNSFISLVFMSMALLQSPTPTPAPIEIVDKVRQFYTDAWNMLILYVTILIAIVGVVIPLIIQRYQNRTFRLEEEKLKDNLIKENKAIIEKAINERAADLQKQMDENMERITASLKQEMARSLTGTLMVQTSFLWTEKRYLDALESGLSAIKSALQSGNQANVQRALRNVTRDILPNISKQQYEQQPYIKEKIEDTFKTLEAENTDGRYTNYIRDLQSAYKKSLEPEDQKE